MPEIILSKDWNKFLGDLKNIKKRLNGLTKYALGRIVRKTAKAYVKSYNNNMTKEANPTLATAKIGRSTQSKNEQRTSVIVGLNSIGYDIGKSHHVSLKRMIVKNWVKDKWRYGAKKGWYPTKKISSKSLILGNKENPKGTLYVTSRATRGEYIIQDKAFEDARATFVEEFRRAQGRISTYTAKDKLLSDKYIIKMTVKNIGG